MIHERRELQEVGVEAFAPRASLVMDILQMAQEAGFVLLAIAAGRTHRVHGLHVLDQLIRHFEHLFTMVTRKELTGSLMFAVMNPQVELLTEGDLALSALELVLPLNGHVLVANVVFHRRQFVGGEGTLVAVVTVADVVIIDEGIQLVLGGRHAALGLRFVLVVVLRY